MNKFFKSRKVIIVEDKSGKRKLSFIEIFFIVISILIVLISPFLLRPILYSEGKVSCLSNQRQIAALLQMYAQDHEEILPLSSSIWRDIQVDKPVLICPEAKKMKNGYLYNNNLSGVNIGKIADPSKKMITIDGKTTISPGRIYDNIYYTPTDVQFRNYEKEKNMYWTTAAYLDGHVTMVNKITEPESWDKPK